MESYSIIVMIFGGCVFVLLVLLYFVNRILQYKLRIDNSFRAIKDIMDDRCNIVDDMLLFLSNNLELEKSYYKTLVSIKKKLESFDNNKDGVVIYKDTDEGIMNFCLLENTYKYLIKNKDYLNIKDSIISNRDKMLYAIDTYDKGVINYNDYKGKGINKFIGRLCNFSDYDCYNK